MKKIFLLFILSQFSLSCQNYGKLELITSFPSVLDEISGIEFVTNSELLWTLNDSGNEAKIYGYNLQTNKIQKTITITNGKNKDWEDLASDDKGNLYIGDFGNNRSKRKNQTIYSVIDLARIDSDTTHALKTTFYFEDQKRYPAKRKNRNYDVEAFIFFKNNFYLFTRNRSSEFDGTTKMYKVPAKEGHFKAKLMDEYITCENASNCQITSATYNHKNGEIALLSYNKVWIISDYEKDQFLKGSIKKIKLGFNSQKESVTFKTNKSLLIADERAKNKGGNLYLLKL